MAIDDRTRHELHQRLDGILGVDEAATLMAHLPPTGWGDVVTREYLDHVLGAGFAEVNVRFAEVDVRFAEVDVRFAEVDARFDRLESRMDAHAAAMQVGFDLVQVQIEAASQRTRADARGDLNAAVALQTRTMIFTMLTAMVALSTLAFTFARFI